MNYFYLLINIACLLMALVLSADRKARPILHWRSMLPAILMSGLFFSALAFLFNLFKVWNFNANYILGIYLWQLPVEELLFYFALSFLGLNIYEYLNKRFPGNDLEKFSLSFSNLILGICMAMLFFTYTRWYSVVAFSVLFLILFYVEYINKRRFMYKFYRAYVVSLIPFYLSYAIINGLPILSYSAGETTKIMVGTIPFENHFYFMAMLLLSVYLFETVKPKARI